MPESFVLRCSHASFVPLVVARSGAVLGRGTRCDFVIEDRSISRQHAEIGIRPTGPYVIDLDSRNGTFVDDRRVGASELVHGQVVRFGTVSFDVLVEEESGSSERTDDIHGDSAVPGNMAAGMREGLSEAQRKVFDRLLTGLAEKSIARQLGLSQHTVHNHVRAIFRTIGVHSRPELFALLLQSRAKQSQ